MTIKKASQASGYIKKISSLEEKVSSLTVKVLHNAECESFILGIVESACELLRCEFSFDFFFPCLRTVAFVTFLPLQVLVWILFLKNVELLSETLLWRKCRLAARLCGLILDAGAPLYCFKSVPSTLASQLMVVSGLSR
jgi:hypothetical protein